MSAPHHSRKSSSRAALPRRPTRGPLDVGDDPLSPSSTGTPSLASSRNSPLPLSPQDETNDPLLRAVNRQVLPPAAKHEAAPSTESDDRDLSFLLDASIYHPLSQVDVPGPFRKPFLAPPTLEMSPSQSMEQLDLLLSQCEFLRAAHFAAAILTSGIVQPNDSKTIFRLLEIRYSCLELTNNLLLASQEAKSLEDISSAFYYADPAPGESTKPEGDDAKALLHHIMPFSLRLQALRLQSIGFSDPRRGVSTLYDLAYECREHLLAASATTDERQLWTRRLHEVSIRVVNALVEMGDLDCAVRTMESFKPGTPDEQNHWIPRMVLLAMKMGNVAKARHLIESSQLSPADQLLLQSLLSLTEGRFDDAAKLLAETDFSNHTEMKALVKQNLTVAHLYRGEIQRSRQLLEELLEDGHSFQTLTINLATIYDLSSDRSRDLKTSMISSIAANQSPASRQRSFVNADFKM